MRNKEPVIEYRLISVLEDVDLQLELFVGNKSIERQVVSITNNYYLFLPPHLERSDYVCITTIFDNNATMKKCVHLPDSKLIDSCEIRTQETDAIQPIGLVLGSLFGISLIILLIYRKRQRQITKSNQHLENNASATQETKTSDGGIDHDINIYDKILAGTPSENPKNDKIDESVKVLKNLKTPQRTRKDTINAHYINYNLK